MLHALLFLQSSLGSCLTLRGGSGQDIGRAMSACSEAGGGTVRLSAGNFSLFSATDLAPSILLSGLSDVNLAGDGALDAPCASHSSRLILQDLAAGFSITNCSNITFSNFLVASARLPYTFGRCTAVGPTSAVIRFDPSAYPFPSARNTAPYLFKALAIMEFDTSLKAPPHGGTDIYTQNDPISIALGPAADEITLLRDFRSQLFVGSDYVVRHAIYGGDA